ncbi:MAG TPA: glycosyltransferase [Polyangia bacterium]|nr:glycosyltransferase [Polyangia bacterium]
MRTPAPATMRALVIAYAFPPTGGAGVGRPLKLVKYLPAHGVRPAVLTASNPSVPLRDESLLADLPPDVEIVRVRTLEPGYAVKQAGWTAQAGGSEASAARPGRRLVGRAVMLGRQALVPDPQILWQPAAQMALAGRLARKADDVVLISAPPFSQFLLAPLARLRPGVGVVLDYRDEWSTVQTSYVMQARWSARLGATIERTLLRAAHLVTTATEAFRQNLLDRFSFLSAEQVVAIPNGYDPDDFPASLAGPAPGADRFTVTYAGTVFNLTSPGGFLRAVRRLHAEAPDLARRLRVRFLGRITETEREAFAGLEALGVECAGYVPHVEVTQALAASHLALCILDEVPGVERIYPAKIFELGHLSDRTGLEVLTLAPPGALADLVRAHRIGPHLPPRDEVAIAALLKDRLSTFVSGGALPRARPVGMERYDRRALAGEFAQVLARARDQAAGR